MRKLYSLGICLFAAGVMSATGCGEKSPPGGPGVKRDGAASTTQERTPIVGTAENTFRINTPSETDVKQGNTAEMTVGIDRGKNFDQDVVLSFDGAPKGVTFSPDRATVKNGEKNVKINVNAAADAPRGGHKVTVVGTPKTGPATSVQFRIDVENP